MYASRASVVGAEPLPLLLLFMLLLLLLLELPLLLELLLLLDIEGVDGGVDSTSLRLLKGGDKGRPSSSSDTSILSPKSTPVS